MVCVITTLPLNNALKRRFVSRQRKPKPWPRPGRLSLDFASHQMAEHYFQQSLEQKDATAETFARLAELYERLHRVEDASRLVDRALQLDGTCSLALLARARLDRQAGRLEEAEQTSRYIFNES